MDEFQLLSDQAKELFKAFPELEFKTLAALTIIIGWLLTSGNAQQFLSTHSFLSQLGTTIAMGSFAIVQIAFLRGHYKKIETVLGQLEKLAVERGFSSVVVDTYRVSPILPVSYALINIVFSSAIVVVVYVLGQG